MATKTIVEQHGSSVTYRADKNYDVPNMDILTFLLDSTHTGTQSPDQLVHADAANPSLSLTKAQVIALTQRIAHTLRHAYGIGADPARRDYVTCIAAGSYVLPTIFYGTLAAGAVFSSVSSSATVKELVRFIQQAPSDLVVCSPETRDVAVAAAREAGLSEARVLVVDAPGQGLREARSGRQVLGQERLDWKRLRTQRECEDTPACLIYSSGTTGLPKGVVLNHRNIVSQTYIPCTLIRDQMSFDYRTLAHLPTAHIAGMQGYFMNPVFMGGVTYWMAKFDFAEFLEYNRKYKISFFFTVPPIYLLISKSPAVTDQFDNLHYAISGAAPMGKELQEAVSARLGKGKTFVSQTWGLSETTGSVTLMNYGENDLSGSVSRLLPNMSMRIVDDDGNDVPVGSEGEFLCRGPVVFSGYHNNPTANSTAFDSAGWFRTGDVGMFKDGLFYIVDRKKELIKYKGMQVAPAELEALLISHADILDAAVIGVDWEGTEAPRAYVVADKNKMSADAIKAFVKANVASHKQLRGGVVFLEAIPKSASGKILRKDLRLMAKAEQEPVKAKL